MILPWTWLSSWWGFGTKTTAVPTPRPVAISQLPLVPKLGYFTLYLADGKELQVAVTARENYHKYSIRYVSAETLCISGYKVYDGFLVSPHVGVNLFVLPGDIVDLTWTV